MKDNFDRLIDEPKTVAATTKFLELVGEHFSVLEDFHPGFTNSVTLVDRETYSAITVVIVESSDKEDDD